MLNNTIKPGKKAREFSASVSVLIRILSSFIILNVNVSVINFNLMKLTNVLLRQLVSLLCARSAAGKQTVGAGYRI